jgi:hypothetical protein
MAFTYKLELRNGSPSDPPTLRTAAPTRPDDTIPLGRDRKLRVIDTRLDEGTNGDPRLRARGRSRLKSEN